MAVEEEDFRADISQHRDVVSDSEDHRVEDKKYGQDRPLLTPRPRAQSNPAPQSKVLALFGEADRQKERLAIENSQNSDSLFETEPDWRKESSKRRYGRPPPNWNDAFAFNTAGAVVPRPERMMDEEGCEHFEVVRNARDYEDLPGTGAPPGVWLRYLPKKIPDARFGRVQYLPPGSILEVCHDNGYMRERAGQWPEMLPVNAVLVFPNEGAGGGSSENQVFYSFGLFRWVDKNQLKSLGHDLGKTEAGLLKRQHDQLQTMVRNDLAPGNRAANQLGQLERAKTHTLLLHALVCRNMKHSLPKQQSDLAAVKSSTRKLYTEIDLRARHLRRIWEEERQRAATAAAERRRVELEQQHQRELAALEAQRIREEAELNRRKERAEEEKQKNAALSLKRTTVGFRVTGYWNLVWKWSTEIKRVEIVKQKMIAERDEKAARVRLWTQEIRKVAQHYTMSWWYSPAKCHFCNNWVPSFVIFVASQALGGLIWLIVHIFFPHLVAITSGAIGAGSSLGLWIFGRNFDGVAQPGRRVHLLARPSQIEADDVTVEWTAGGDIAVVCATCAVARNAVGRSDRPTHPTGEWSDPMGFRSFDAHSSDVLADQLNGVLFEHYRSATAELDRVVGARSLEKSLAKIFQEVRERELPFPIDLSAGARTPPRMVRPSEEGVGWRFGAENARTFVAADKVVLQGFVNVKHDSAASGQPLPSTGGTALPSTLQTLTICKDEIVLVTRESAESWIVQLSATENADTRTVTQRLTPDVLGGKHGSPTHFLTMTTDALRVHAAKLKGRGLAGVLKE